MSNLGDFGESRLGDFMESPLGDRQAEMLTCPDITELALAQISPYRARITWKDPATLGTSLVYRSLDRITWTLLGVGTQTSFGSPPFSFRYDNPIVGGTYLTPATTYYYAVKARTCMVMSTPITVRTWPDPIYAGPDSLPDCAGSCDVGGGFTEPVWDGYFYWQGHGAGYKDTLGDPSAAVGWRTVATVTGNRSVGGMLIEAAPGADNFGVANQPHLVGTYWELGIGCKSGGGINEYATYRLVKAATFDGPLGTYARISGTCGPATLLIA